MNIGKILKNLKEAFRSSNLPMNISGEYTLHNNVSVENFSISHPSAPELKISTEILDLVWIGDGVNKNYVPETQKRNTRNADSFFSITTYNFEREYEPSALYISLPISKPSDGTVVQRPPYYPVYKELLPEQRWLYWQFLSDPFSGRHDIGYVFLFYYGLERHLLSGNIEKAFDVILKLRNIYDNTSFQSYSANALTLVSIAKQRSDLALKLLESYIKNDYSFLPTDYLLMLKYTFQIPLTPKEIIKNHKYFGFDNTLYLKNQYELFYRDLCDIIDRDYHSNSINLNEYFPTDIHSLSSKQRSFFANMSLYNYELSTPDFKNKELNQRIHDLLNETHGKVKVQLREMRKNGPKSSVSKKVVSSKRLSPIESEHIPRVIRFDLSEFYDCDTWDDDRIYHTYFSLFYTIKSDHSVLAKLEACEKSYLLLKRMINIFQNKTGEVFSSWDCVSYGVSLYKKLANWNDAKRVINTCIKANPYHYTDGGLIALDQLKEYETIANIAIDFIRKNPGFLQKDIYVALCQVISENKMPILKTFMRETYVFHKQQYGGTNQLYYIERD